MHWWGDEGVDWVGISDAARFIGLFCRRWGRIFVMDYKEKYGTVRVYCSFGHYSLHGLLFPGYAYKRPWFPKWLWTFDIYWLSKIFTNRFIGYPIFLYQIFIYKLAYFIAVHKWSHLREEILDSPDHGEYLKFLGYKGYIETNEE